MATQLDIFKSLYNRDVRDQFGYINFARGVDEILEGEPKLLFVSEPDLITVDLLTDEVTTYDEYPIGVPDRYSDDTVFLYCSKSEDVVALEMSEYLHERLLCIHELEDYFKVDGDDFPFPIESI